MNKHELMQKLEDIEWEDKTKINGVWVNDKTERVLESGGEK